MTQHHAHEGAEAHHQHPPFPLEAEAPFNMNEAVAVGAQEWLAREFVGGLLAIADAQGADRTDFIADKCVLLAHRLANAESESRVLSTQLQVLVNENHELHRKIDDCGCHDAQIADNDEIARRAVELEGFITRNGESR